MAAAHRNLLAWLMALQYLILLKKLTYGRLRQSVVKNRRNSKNSSLKAEAGLDGKQVEGYLHSATILTSGITILCEG
jgi:hypothetical protein